MKKYKLLIFLIVFLFSAVFLIERFMNYDPNKPLANVRITKPSSEPITFCTSQDLKASIELDAAAGNIYGSLTLTNISNKVCDVQAASMVKANYDAKTIKNIKVTYVGDLQKDSYRLSPKDTLYSKIHYPNGPQCMSATKPTTVSFSYDISPTDSVFYKDKDANANQIIQACPLPQDITRILIWNMSSKPLIQ